MSTLFILIFAVVSVASLQCMDENNNPIDWYVAIKLPKLKNKSSLFKEGMAYLYMTSDNYDNWILSEKSINSSDSIMANTISHLYSQEDLFHILYNDEPPHQKASETNGHTKGVILANQDGGLWLIHSTPHFPSKENSYSFPASGTIYGQSFLCISFDLKNMNDIGLQLQYNEPNIYSVNIPEELVSSLPDLVDAARNQSVKISPWYRQTELQSSSGQSFISFAKSKNFGKELYSSWVAPILQTNLYVETWRKGPGDIPSECDKTFKVCNIQQVNLSDFLYLTTEDHSKWAVSYNSKNSIWTCIGDINRQEHQLKRGGGTVCLHHKEVGTHFLNMVSKVETC